METFKRTPQQLFSLPQHFVIPLFQRKYVWDEEEQWAPLWKDIRRIADLKLAESASSPQHFLGAVVLQAYEARSANVQSWNVIDGQQRLTTLQLLMDATSAVLAERGASKAALQLDALTHNPSAFVSGDEPALKLRHLNVDRAAFDEVMEAPAPVDYANLDHQRSLLARAHQYFTDAVGEWLGAGDDSVPRGDVLAEVLQSNLQLVTIELLSTEDSQEIFETLNARGTPLTAADMVRNFVFQRLEAEGADTAHAYARDWPFDTPFWSKEVSVGRTKVSRNSLFLNQWLVSRIGEEISPHATFTRFKSYVNQSGTAMGMLLPILKEQADLYERWTAAAADPGRELNATEMAVYRMQAGGIELLKPLLIWLHEPGRTVAEDDIAAVIRVAESWVYRRQLLRLSNSDLGRVVADLIASVRAAPTAELPERIAGHLSRLNVASTYWPGDDEIRTQLFTAPAYTRFPRPRLRGFLEAIEDSYRAETGQPQVARTGLPIEHVLPQRWQDTWPVDDEAAAAERQAHVNRLGNLTLLTTSLNSKVSNAAWGTKCRALRDHNTITMTGRLLTLADGADWSERLIDARTGVMIDALLSIWPVPAGHQGTVVDRHAKTADGVTIGDLVVAGLLAVGARLKGRRPGIEAVVGEGGTIMLDGKRFTSPSGASRHVSDGRQVNGWLYWSLDDGRSLSDVRTELRTGA
ncbi:DUF262 domain-containing protein [Gordonia sp. PP30]|uniref:GmrSD restriction endonuclease domain-containing protein n=1 Tax=Gordonia sp. PP30 TaxID=2935861 RepID=UPI0020002D42|nr:DUF262 domain-containing protein [Gordonia sp. PP30]UQE75973.1 DUF262 domain-containing protein [Gordonia sp. PP30]